ncbi:MAG: rhodanese-like domain-containing protein [Oscillospiraceae bacterium]|nr:rhodanese-like domain-containing protein [Oscillospiraceae bacterium]
MLKTKKAKFILAVIVVVIILAIAISVWVGVFLEREDGNLNDQNDISMNGEDEPRRTFANIDASTAREQIREERGITILDVRTLEEHQGGHIPDSILIPVNELENRAINELQDKQARIFVYCRSGVRSVTASEILIRLGFENVYNLGGINNWPYEVI